MSKVLLIEDEEQLATMVQLYLKTRLITVERTADGTDGLFMLQSECFDAAIVDWNLPGMEGTEIIRKYRMGGGVTPVIMLTGRGELQEKVVGFDCGADDYLTKPFQAEELYLRIKSLMRRPREIRTTQICVGDLKLVPEKGIALIRDKPVKLTRKEFAILELLARHKGQNVNMETIIGRVWSVNAEVSIETVRTHIANLRVKLRDSSETMGCDIKNIYGGYLLEESAQ